MKKIELPIEAKFYVYLASKNLKHLSNKELEIRQLLINKNLSSN